MNEQSQGTSDEEPVGQESTYSGETAGDRMAGDQMASEGGGDTTGGMMDGMEEAASGAREKFTVVGKDLVERVRGLIHEGNIRRITIRREGRTILELPVTVAAIGIVIAPMLAAVGAVAAVVTDCEVEIERSQGGEE